MNDLLPVHRPHLHGRRPWKDDRAALRGILFVFKKDIPMVGPTRRTIWRLRDDVLAHTVRLGSSRSDDALQQRLLDELGGQGQIDQRHANMDPHWSGQKGDLFTAPNLTDSAKAGSKHHVVMNRKGLPFGESITATNVYDSREARLLLDDISPVKGPRGRPRKRPSKLRRNYGFD